LEVREKEWAFRVRGEVEGRGSFYITIDIGFELLDCEI
jgi:hypothetical protein